jgi:hypothetical protein
VSDPSHTIRAIYGERTIRVYRAYNDEIAEAALDKGRLVSPPFKLDRMTWVEPSFLWMMYRAGWGYKDAGQRRILAIDICPSGFEWALAHSCPSRPDGALSRTEYDQLKAASPVRIQWDPDRDLALQPLNRRAIQIGLRGEAVSRYLNEWIEAITEVTALAHSIEALARSGRAAEAERLLPVEMPYPLPLAMAARIGATPPAQ